MYNEFAVSSSLDCALRHYGLYFAVQSKKMQMNVPSWI